VFDFCISKQEYPQEVDMQFMNLFVSKEEQEAEPGRGDLWDLADFVFFLCTGLSLCSEPGNSFGYYPKFYSDIKHKREENLQNLAPLPHQVSSFIETLL